MKAREKKKKKRGLMPTTHNHSPYLPSSKSWKIRSPVAEADREERRGFIAVATPTMERTNAKSRYSFGNVEIQTPDMEK